MDPTSRPPGSLTRPAPRARGDGPRSFVREPRASHCSPRTRGWTRGHSAVHVDRQLLPAHAGMDPTAIRPRYFFNSAPRARGDGPTTSAVPIATATCSPRTRGWTRAGWQAQQSTPAAPRARGDGPAGKYVGISGNPLLPAHAGMDPEGRAWLARLAAAPRARGDGPVLQFTETVAAICSPRTRGWTHIEAPRGGTAPLLPAHAGMDPSQSRGQQRRPAAPRARGDGPKVNDS